MVLTEINQFVGKTLERVEDNGYDEVVFVFSDGDCAVIEAAPDYDGCVELCLKGKLSDRQKVLCGIMTEEELSVVLRKRAEERRVEQENYELRQLARLRAKYESGFSKGAE